MSDLNTAIVTLFETAHELFFDDDTDSDSDSDRDDGVERREIRKVSLYVEIVVSHMDDITFKSRFRMSRSTVEMLVANLGCKLSNDGSRKGRPAIEPTKQVLMALYTFAHQCSYRPIAELFGVTVSACHGCVQRVCGALLQFNTEKKVISWPDAAAAAHNMAEYENKYKFPGIIGAIDGSHISISAPATSPSSYVNRKGFHSIVLQGVCDYDLKFIDCYAGEVGSVHDACVFRRSPLLNIMNKAASFPSNSHLLGDSAYPLMPSLLVGYKDNGHLSARQVQFNERLSAARSTIERAFALLKGRFRRLKHLDMKRTDLIPPVIIACCVLHNICIDKRDIIDLADEEAMEEMGSDIPNAINVGSQTDRQVALAKCERISRDMRGSARV